MKKFLKNKKAISPVISTLIIIATIFAMFAIIYPWAVSSLTLQQSIANVWYTSQQEALKERISIEMIVFNHTTNKIDVYIRNVGEIDVKIVAIYLNATDVSSFVNPPLTNGYSIYAKASGSENVVRFSIDWPWNENEVYVIKAVTARGSYAISRARA